MNRSLKAFGAAGIVLQNVTAIIDEKNRKTHAVIQGSLRKLFLDFLFVVSPPALIRREWKSRYDRVIKAVGSPAAPDAGDLAGVELVTQEQSTTPKRKQGSERVASCPPHCNHSASLPSDILIEIKVCLLI